MRHLDEPIVLSEIDVTCSRSFWMRKPSRGLSGQMLVANTLERFDFEAYNFSTLSSWTRIPLNDLFCGILI